MTLAVFLTRRSHLKILSTVIDASLARGHDTLLVAAVRAAKKGDRLDVKELRRLWPTVRIEVTLPFWVDAVIAPDAVMPPGRMRRVSVAGWYDDLWLRPPATDGRVQCYISGYHQRQHYSLWKIHRDVAKWNQYFDTSRIVGWLPGDQGFSLHRGLAYGQGVALEDLMGKVFVPKKDSAVLFSLKLGVEPWRDTWEGRKFYRAIVRGARDRAHAEGLRFVVKTRAKNRDPLWLRWYADEIVHDVNMVPATSLSLLARARWMVSFESGAVWEAAVMGCYSIAIPVPQPHIMGLPGSSLQYGGDSVLHNWPGVTQYGMPDGPTPAVNSGERERYLAKLLGPCDGRVGERVVMVAEGKQ